MDSEHRHELKTNALADRLAHAPAFFQQHGSRILLGVISVLLVYILSVQYMANKEQKKARAGDALGNAIYALRLLKQSAFQPPNALPDTVIADRKQRVKEVDESVKIVLDAASDPKMKSQALVVLGDLYWVEANLPALPGATTRPELALGRTSSEFLAEAEKSYNAAIATEGADHTSVILGRLGLGYVAENKSDWEAARKAFQQVVDDASADKGFRDFATAQIDGMRRLQTPEYAGTTIERPIVTPSTTPVTIPPVYGPAVPNVTTRPSSMPAVVPPASSGAPAFPPSVPTTAPSVELPSVTLPPATLPAVTAPSVSPPAPSAGPSVLPTTQPAATQPSVQ